MTLSKKAIAQALSLSDFNGLEAQSKMKPMPRAGVRPPEKAGQPRQGAVLLLLYKKSDEIHLVLTRRRDDLQAHAGQISFPGGRHEAAETLKETALRETYEEVGIPPDRITILGELTSLYVLPSDFEVHPFVGWHERVPVFVPQASEVAEIIEVPVAHLLRAEARDEELWERRGILMQVPFFRVGTHKVWGATAMMLSEFVERLRVQVDGHLAQ